MPMRCHTTFSLRLFLCALTALCVALAFVTSAGHRQAAIIDELRAGTDRDVVLARYDEHISVVTGPSYVLLLYEPYCSMFTGERAFFHQLNRVVAVEFGGPNIAAKELFAVLRLSSVRSVLVSRDTRITMDELERAKKWYAGVEFEEMVPEIVTLDGAIAE